jgi:hypothetical protein
MTNSVEEPANEKRNIQPLSNEDVDEREWLKSASANPVFAFLADEKEDIYNSESKLRPNPQ